MEAAAQRAERNSWEDDKFRDVRKAAGSVFC